MMYTEPRFTKDLDVWVEPTHENASNVLRALAEFGAPVGNLSVPDFMEPSHIYQIGVNPVRIDIIMNIPGVEFSEAWIRRNVVDIGGQSASFLSKEDLITAKRAAGRPQDRLDLRRLLKSGSKSSQR